MKLYNLKEPMNVVFILISGGLWLVVMLMMFLCNVFASQTSYFK